MNSDVVERMSPDLPSPASTGATNEAEMAPFNSVITTIATDMVFDAIHSSPPDQPKDLSIRRKSRPVPPPLDLSKRTLESMPGVPCPPHVSLLKISDPLSPSMQKNLPLRKRAHSWSSQPGNLCVNSSSSVQPISSTITTIKDEEWDDNEDEGYSYRMSSSNTSLRIPGLPTPHTPHTPHPHSAIPVLTSRFNFTEGNASVPLNLSTGGTLPSSLLSPAPSHPSTSSLSSSREELENESMQMETSSAFAVSASQLPYHAIHSKLHPSPSHHNGVILSMQPSQRHSMEDKPSVSHIHYADIAPTDSTPPHLKPDCVPTPFAKLEPSTTGLYTQLEEHPEDEIEGASSFNLKTEDLSSHAHYYNSRHINGIKEELHASAESCLTSDFSNPYLHYYASFQHATKYSPYLPGNVDVKPPLIEESECDGVLNLSESSSLHHDSSNAYYSSQPPQALPPIVWSIFMAGVRIHFILKPNQQLTTMQLSEELQQIEERHQQHYAPHGLHLLKLNAPVQSMGGTEVKLGESFLAHLHLCPLRTHQEDIVALVPLHHPFFVRGKGWCSADPELTRQVYGLPCSQLADDDICLPPRLHEESVQQSSDSLHHPVSRHVCTEASAGFPPTAYTRNNTHTPDCVAEAIRRFDFNDEQAVLDARTAARLSGVPISSTTGGFPHFPLSVPPVTQHFSGPTPSNAFYSQNSSSSTSQYTTLMPVSQHQQRSVFMSPPASPSKKTGSRPPATSSSESGAPIAAGSQQTRPRRPMNGFMLFAKHHRLKLIQQYPGKDNRAISVLLGAAWKSLPVQERERINNEARLQAEARKLIDPDCWKRKRSQSTS